MPKACSTAGRDIRLLNPQLQFAQAISSLQVRCIFGGAQCSAECIGKGWPLESGTAAASGDTLPPSAGRCCLSCTGSCVLFTLANNDYSCRDWLFYSPGVLSRGFMLKLKPGCMKCKASSNPCPLLRLQSSRQCCEPIPQRSALVWRL